MYCPRCGTPNEPGDKFCSSCGATLRGTAAEPAPPPSARQRLADLVGTSRRARLITVATLAALAVAIVAFVALQPSDSIPRDGYTIAADRICLDAKRKIVLAERQALRGGAEGEPTSVAQALVPVVSGWRSEFQAMRVPSDRLEQAVALTEALRKVEIELAALSLAIERGNRAETAKQAKRVDAATVGVEEAVSGLNLERCAAATIGLSQPAS